MINRKFDGHLIKNFKNELTHSIVSSLVVVQENYSQLVENPDYLNIVRELGKQKAEYIAEVNIAKIKETIGI